MEDESSPTTAAITVDYGPEAIVTDEDEDKDREKGEEEEGENDSPLCSSFYTKATDVNLRTQLMSHQDQALAWMRVRERVADTQNGGGILADDMGLGKTLDCIALMVDSLRNCRRLGEGSKPGSMVFPMINLVVVPFSLLPQWREEILQHTDAPDSAVLTYHGSNRRDSLNRFINRGRGFVVLTTYEVIRQEYSEEMKRRTDKDAPRGRRKGTIPSDPSPLFVHTWYRIFLDEAHRIRTNSNVTTKAVCFLLSRRRWCITGTPFNNKIDDLITLCRFIGIAPYNSTHWWNVHGADHRVLAAWVETYVLNRTKDILNLPPQDSLVVTVEFEREEQVFYSRVFSDALRQYMRFKNTHGSKRFKMFGTVLSWLIRLRQVCDHPLLMLGRAWTRPYADKSSAGEFHAKEVCCLCKESADDVGYLKDLECGHYVCQFCTMKDVRCSSCEQLSLWLGEEIVTEETNSSQTRYSLRNRREPRTVRVRRYRINSKCRAIIDFCKERLGRDESNKIVIFSQWTGFLDLLENFFGQEGLNFLRYDGDIAKADARNSVIREFRTPESGRIILCSLQCGGLGLNLTVANIAILADSWYNPFLEKQAVDRVHRIGQTKPVEVVRFIVNRSIEMDVSRIQERKKATAGNILSGVGMSAPTRRDLGDVASGISEMDVHEIFRKASNAVTVRKNVVKAPDPSPKRARDPDDRETAAKKRKSALAHFIKC
jgi:SNF2 family DNA or RNA helicase